MKLITAATVVLILALPNTEELSGGDISQEIIGNELQARRMGMTLTILHQEDGRSVLRLPFRTREGRWTIKNDELCVQWSSSEEMDCIQFIRNGPGAYRVEPMGMVVRLKQPSIKLL